MFSLNPDVNYVGCIFKNKTTKEFYIKIDEQDSCGQYVRLEDNYIYSIGEDDMELWTLIK